MCDSECRNHMGEKLADTISFLFRFCAKYNFDFGNIMVDKIIKKDKKYPVSMIKGSSKKTSFIKEV